MTQELFLHLVSHIENFRRVKSRRRSKANEFLRLFVRLVFFQERCYSSCVGQGKYLQILRSDALQFRGIILRWHRPAEALDVRKKTWCTRKICVNNLRFFHVTYGNTYRYRYTKRHITASRLLSATLVVMTRIRKILDEKTAFFVHVSLGAILCDFLKSMLRVFSLGSMKEDFIIL